MISECHKDGYDSPAGKSLRFMMSFVTDFLKFYHSNNDNFSRIVYRIQQNVFPIAQFTS